MKEKEIRTLAKEHAENVALIKKVADAVCKAAVDSGADEFGEAAVRHATIAALWDGFDARRRTDGKHQRRYKVTMSMIVSSALSPSEAVEIALKQAKTRTWDFFDIKTDDWGEGEPSSSPTNLSDSEAKRLQMRCNYCERRLKDAHKCPACDFDIEICSTCGAYS